MIVSQMSLLKWKRNVWCRTKSWSSVKYLSIANRMEDSLAITQIKSVTDVYVQPWRRFQPGNRFVIEVGTWKIIVMMRTLRRYEHVRHYLRYNIISIYLLFNSVLNYKRDKFVADRRTRGRTKKLITPNSRVSDRLKWSSSNKNSFHRK